MSSQPERYDMVVLGSGEAGKYLAWDAAASGRKTALIERRYIGGSCPNIACLPSKNIIHSASVAHLARQARDFGLQAPPPGVDMEVIRGRKRRMVEDLVKIHVERFERTGVEFIHGEGRFVGPGVLEVNLTEGGARSVSAETVVISTGSRATLEPIPGLADARPLTPVEALELAVVPAHLLVLGGGYVGLEFAQAMRRFGSDVTIIERNGRLLHREDEDVSGELTRLFVAEGIQLVTGVHLHSVSGRSGEQVTLNGERDGKPFELRGSHLLVATGRTPNTSELGLKAAGVERTATGFVQVDDRLRTTASGVFAVGDCAGSPQFTHAAFDDFRVVRDGLAGGSRSTTGRLMPSCLFVDPELARVGLSESEARRRGIPYLLLKLPMKAVLRTRTTGELSGFLKALVDPENSRILGFTGLGSYAGEMLAPVQLAMNAGLPYTALRDSIFAHPTYSEGLVYLFSAKPERPE